MSEETTIFRGVLEYDVREEEAISAIDRLKDSVNRFSSELPRFETEVRGLGDAFKLAMEAPQQPLMDFISLAHVGLAQMKEGGAGVATGFSLVGMALENITARIPAVRGLAPVFGAISNAGHLVGKVIQEISNRTGGLEGHMSRVMRLTSDLGESLAKQSLGMKIMHQEDIRLLREVVQERKAEVAMLERTEAPIMRILEAKYALKDAEEEYNVALRVQGPLIQQARGHLMGARTALKHLATEHARTGKVAVGRLEDVRYHTRQYRIEMERMGKAGVEIPKEMRKTYGELTKVLKEWSREAKKQANEVEKAAKKTKGLGLAAREAAKGGEKMTRSFAATVSVSRSLSGAMAFLPPEITTVTFAITRLGDQFTRGFQQMQSAVEAGVPKIQAALGLVKMSLLTLGAIATGLMIKAGMLAAEVTTLEVTLRTVARNIAAEAGGDVNRFADYVMDMRDAIVETGITTREATKALVQFTRAKLPIDKVRQLAEDAKNLGVTVANLSSSEVFGRFIEVISTGRTALLKALNVTKTVVQMHEEYAESIGKVSAKSLTVAEKRLAIIEGLHKVTATVAGVYEEAQKTASKQLSSMKRLMEESLLVIGERFEPLLARVIFSFNKFLQWFKDLPPVVHDNIASIVKWTAAAGGLLTVVITIGPALKKLIPLIKLLGTAIHTALPWMLAISAAIAAIVVVVKAARYAWDRDIGGIQETVKSFVNMLKTTFGPIIKDLLFWIKMVMSEIDTALETISQTIALAIGWMSKALTNVEGVFARVFGTLKDVVNGFGMAVWKVFKAFNALLRGDTAQAITWLESAVIDVTTSIALIFKNLVVKAATWGWNLIVEVANGITKAATQILANVMRWIGQLIGRFLAPGSPPKEGPLSHIVESGRGVMETFLRAFGTADFGILRDVMSPIKAALESAVAAGKLGEKELIPTLQSVRKEMAHLLADFRETGETNEEIMTNISDKLGEGGRDLVEYVRRVLDHQRALKRLTGVQEEYAAAEAKGFVSAEMKARLSAAEEEAEATKDAVSWQREFVAAMQETVGMQLRQLKLLERMAKAMEKIAKTGIGKALKEKPVPLIELPFELPEMPEEADISALGFDPGFMKSLGRVSEDFLEMRKKVEGFIQAIKDWFALPLDEKWESIKTSVGEAFTSVVDWLEEITGWDISGWVEDVETFFTDAWAEIVRVTQWLYDQLVGESIIPDLVDEVLKEFERLRTDPFGWIAEKFEGLKESFDNTITGIQETFDGIREKIQSAWKAIEPIAKALITVFTRKRAIRGGILDSLREGWEEHGEDILESFQGLFDAIADSWERLEPTLGPILKFLGIIVGAAFLTALGLAASIIESLTDTLDRVMPRITAAIEGIVEVVIGFVHFAIMPIVDTIVALFQLLTGDTEGAAESMEAAWENVKKGLGMIGEGILKVIVNLGAGLIEAVIGFVFTLLETFGNFGIDVLEGFGILDEDTAALWRDMWNGIWTDAQEWLDNISETFTGWIADAIEIWNSLRDQVSTIWGALWGKDGYIMTKLSEAWEAIKKWFINLYEWLVGESLLTDLVDEIVGLWEHLWEKTGEWWESIKTTIGDKIAEVLTNIINMGVSFYNAGKGLVDSIKGGIMDAWNNLKSKFKGGLEVVANMLPFSEPKDTSSPLYGLKESGQAFWENWLEGARSVDLGGAIAAQLSGVAMQLQPAAASVTKSFTFNEGAFAGAFPGVRDGRDGRDLVRQMQSHFDQADLRSR